MRRLTGEEGQRVRRGGRCGGAEDREGRPPEVRARPARAESPVSRCWRRRLGGSLVLGIRGRHNLLDRRLRRL